MSIVPSIGYCIEVVGKEEQGVQLSAVKYINVYLSTSKYIQVHQSTPNYNEVHQYTVTFINIQ